MKPSVRWTGLFLLALCACRGPQGSPGAKGTAGRPGALAVVTVSKRHTIPAETKVQLQLDCPAGKKVLAGGFDGAQETLRFDGSWPVDEGTWGFEIHNSFAMTADVTLWAVCATVSD
jgi:hypothetical protein